MFKNICQASNIPFDEVCQRVSNTNHLETMKPKPKNKRHRHVLNKNIFDFYLTFKCTIYIILILESANNKY